jgi:Leucine-rich repeat (LRR) protein
VSDLSALSPLTQLTGLSLNNTAVSDLSALSPLTQLTGLDLSNTAVSDLSALSPLTQLTGLYLSNTAVSSDEITRFETARKSLGLSPVHIFSGES